MGPFLRLAVPASLWAIVGVFHVAHAQVPVNGSFENGLTGWTLGGSARANSLVSANFNNQIAATDGTRMAFLSTGPGNVNGPTARIDGNTINDNDITTLSTTLNFNFFPAVIRYDWSFPSSEEDQGNNFDDIFDVIVGGTRIHSGSTNKPGGASNFPDAPAGPGGQFNVSGGGPTNGTQLRFGVPAFNSLCVAVPGAIPGDNSINLQFRVADQSDRTFDSGLVLDNVRVDTNCGTPGTMAVRQMTLSANSQVETKDGSLIVRFAQNRAPATSSDGSRMVFIANADYGGGNPFYLSQAFMMEGSAFTRLTNFTGDEIQAIEISADGDFAAVSARATPSDNLEIYRINLDNGSVTQITDTSGCDNTSPSVNNNGLRLAFLSTCGSDISVGFNADGNREMVFWNDENFIVNETTACQSFRPIVNSTNSGRIAAFASDCNFTGGNADGNLEIFRMDRQGSVFQQITNTTVSGAVLDSVDINRNGRYLVYIAQDAGGRYVVFRYDNNTGISTFQGVSRPDRLITGVRIIDTNDGEDIFYEALDLFAIPPMPGSLLGHIDVPTQIVTEGIGNSNVSGISAARVGGVPHMYFSVADDLVNMNGDTNLEIFEGRVE